MNLHRMNDVSEADLPRAALLPPARRRANIPVSPLDPQTLNLPTPPSDNPLASLSEPATGSNA